MFYIDNLLENILKIPTGHLGFDYTYKNKNIYEKSDMNVIKYKMNKLSLQAKKNDDIKTNDDNNAEITTNNNNNDADDDQCEDDDPDEIFLERDYSSRLDLGLLEMVTDRDFLINLSLVPGIIL